MLVQAIPLFQDAHILRRNMLEALSDYAYLTNQYLYKGYSDGILSGCELTTTRDSILLAEGVVLFGGQLFLIKEPMGVNYRPTNTTMTLRLCFSDEMRDASFIYREIDMKLEGQGEASGEGLELCRFKLQEGAELRFRYQGFEDRNTEFDTLNTIHAPHAAKGGGTLAPDILLSFAEEMLKSGSLPEADASFCILILGQDGAVNKPALKAYLERRNRRPQEDCSNLGVYRELAGILREVKGTGGGGPAPRKQKWKLMVD